MLIKEKPYTVEMLETVLRFERPEQSPTETMLRIARPFLPYSLQPAGDGSVLPLNRDYMPLGVTRSLDAIDFRSPKFSSLRLPESVIDWSLLERGYFFSDATNPLNGGASGRWEYIFKVWWSLRGLGLRCPDLPIPALEKLSRKFSLDFQQVLSLSEVLP